MTDREMLEHALQVLDDEWYGRALSEEVLKLLEAIRAHLEGD